MQYVEELTVSLLGAMYWSTLHELLFCNWEILKVSFCTDGVMLSLGEKLNNIRDYQSTWYDPELHLQKAVGKLGGFFALYVFLTWSIDNIMLVSVQTMSRDD